MSFLPKCFGKVPKKLLSQFLRPHSYRRKITLISTGTRKCDNLLTQTPESTTDVQEPSILALEGQF